MMATMHSLEFMDIFMSRLGEIYVYRWVSIQKIKIMFFILISSGGEYSLEVFTILKFP